MSEPFKAPKPEPMERHDQYLERVISALEDWVNAKFTNPLAEKK